MNLVDNARRPAAPFDEVAHEYDEHYEENIIARDLRAVFRKTLLEAFPAGSHLLELNCGTGSDAMFLAMNDRRVDACDESSGMLRIAEEKLKRNDCASAVSLWHAGFDDLNQVPGIRFDGAFSNLGGLNCADDLKPISEWLAGRIPPGGKFVACVMNKFSIWEMGSFLFRGKLQSAFRRFGRGPLSAPVGSASINVRYYTPASFAKNWLPWFSAVRAYGLSICSPVPGSARFVAKYPSLTMSLMKLDSHLRSVRPFSFLGDHFVMILQRNPR